jgi:hypothetical protein
MFFFQLSAHLAVIDSEAELNLLLKMKKEDEEIWLGAHDLFKTSEWVTLHDAPMKFVKWFNANQPDNPGIFVKLKFEIIFVFKS